MHISELDTPALLIDLDIMEGNLRKVSTYAAEHGLRLRPHTKTHKSPALARRQIRSGAAGITVAKVSEAEVMMSAEPEDLLVAYPVIGDRKLDRLTPLAATTAITVALDSVEAARQLSGAARRAGVEFGVLAEMDVGLGRVGVQPGDDLVRLARQIEGMAALTLRGIAFYPGHIKLLDEAGLEKIRRLSDVVEQAVQDFRRAGLCHDIVSGGSTPTLFQSHQVKGMNEIRPGTYIFNDRNTAVCGGCTMDDCAASILVTVVSTARHNGMMIDGGSKTFSSDRLVTTGEASFGRVVEAPETSFFAMNEEHGYVDLSASPVKFTVGDRVRVIPNHICAAVNLHERVYGVRGEEVVESWIVEGRGKLQ